MNALLILALASMVAGWWLRRTGHRAGMAVMLAGLVVAVPLAVRSIVVVDRTPSARARPAVRMAETLGRGVGKELAFAHPEGGEILLLQFPGTTQTEAGRSRALVRALREELGKSFTVTDGLRKEEVEGEPIHPMMFEMGIPTEMFTAWASRNPNAVAAVVYLPGLKVPAPADIDRLPPLYVVVSQGAARAWEPLLRNNLLGGLILFRGLADGLPDESAFPTWSALFDQYYEWFPPRASHRMKR